MLSFFFFFCGKSGNTLLLAMPILFVYLKGIGRIRPIPVVLESELFPTACCQAFRDPRTRSLWLDDAYERHDVIFSRGQLEAGASGWTDWAGKAK